MIIIAELINKVLKNVEDHKAIEGVKREVEIFCKRFV